ncbi:MAG: topoisomerase [Solirubrobacterales bacterium]|nr:topoisomerase [Solirubrobacterales bacterium]
MRRVDCAGPGWTRRKRGRGFELLDERGRTLTDQEARARVAALAIPPAWQDVWICPDPQGHLQATGIDDAGRRQYRYHDAWNQRRSRRKFDETLVFAAGLPLLRQEVRDTLAVEVGRPSAEAVLACVARLLDVGFFRIGSETYARENGTYGLTSMRREHVQVTQEGVVTFDYPAKHGLRRVQHVVDPLSADLVARLKRGRSGDGQLFGWRTTEGWRPLRTSDVSEYLAERVPTGSAKSFRTWHATVLAAVAVSVAEVDAEHVPSRKRVIAHAVKDVARHLGNTPAVCRSSYIDPRVFDKYAAGETIGEVVTRLTAVDDGGLSDTAVHGEVEAAVLDLLGGDASAYAEARGDR